MIDEDKLEGDFIPSYWSLWFLFALVCLLTGHVTITILAVAWFGINIYRDLTLERTHEPLR